MTNFATVDELALDFDLDEKATKIAQRALDSLSEQARFYGRPWTEPSLAPNMVKILVMDAAERHMSNYEGFVSSRAGDETLQWTDRGEDAGSAYFTKREVQQLRALGGRNSGGLSSIPIHTYSSRPARSDIYFGTGDRKPMPFVAAEEAEWWGYE